MLLDIESVDPPVTLTPSRLRLRPPTRARRAWIVWKKYADQAENRSIFLSLSGMLCVPTQKKRLVPFLNYKSMPKLVCRASERHACMRWNDVNPQSRRRRDQPCRGPSVRSAAAREFTWMSTRARRPFDEGSARDSGRYLYTPSTYHISRRLFTAAINNAAALSSWALISTRIYSTGIYQCYRRFLGRRYMQQNRDRRMLYQSLRSN